MDPVAKVDYPVCKLGNVFIVGGDQKAGTPRGLEERFPHNLCSSLVQVGGGFIRQEDRRVGDKRAGYPNALSLAA
ncbi:hypothetical protein VRY54_03760 [Actinomyces sp. F1_1611]|uniref:Uncharacterized protein n=1 Tax=Scrofimicrobium appendicitidis TaxID=3079930 RepID=A0AAU7V604_9ACTO